MSDILEKILATKKAEVEAGRQARPLAQLEREARAAPPPRGFERALRARIAAGHSAVIAEFKRASPSRGVLGASLDPAEVARSYERHGASCLSVLTDSIYFSGSPADLIAARAACALPVLRKDFVVDPWQVHEARAMGADCILLIVGAVDPPALRELERLARSLGMDVLVECHDGDQLEVALGLETSLIGVNNRDLRTFAVRLETTLDLLPRIPAARLLVTESGIASPEHVRRLSEAGVRAYLVGSAFVETGDPGPALSRLFSGPKGGG
ncbi:indole-3-glycerol phosphate synthase TrpC [Usitatibacter palustris]|uniref:Indole-3-glycerol phosphate synthase n=1 Tax=Usitatibacter palustris TaxID=2732487 RepID=A0A6M4H2Z6_9PROT|nr:indole-3-glycerol phosphate synthase TrpC [Usitatibacter palustris]QJR13695.1 Indole-3-glycerol phosphate synthase [Usitatibacter palustris]